MLKSTGIVRKVDELGRIVIPIELRRTLDIGEKPKNFYAKTLSGATFTLKDHLGKTIVIFGYNEDYLQAS